MVGIGTALADDPQLNARIPGVARQPRRVVFDSEGRLPLDSQLVRGAPELPLTVVVGRAASRLRDRCARGGRRRGDRRDGRERARARALGARPARRAPGVTSILLEGGPKLAGAFLDAGELDELRLFIAPVVLGGSNARDPLEGEGVERIAEATRALALDVERIADDVLISARLQGVVSVFTGLVAGPRDGDGRRRDGRRRHARRAQRLAGELAEGDSVAVNGVCLTATAIADGQFSAEVMHETLRRSSLARGRRRAPTSTSSWRCARRTGSAATSCRATSTASARCATCARTASPAS